VTTDLSGLSAVPTYNMKIQSFLSAFALGLSLVSARSPQHVNKKLPNLQPRGPAPASADIHEYKPRKASPTSRYLTDKTKKFVVNGTNIPDVDFDIGESYAGLIPTSNDTNPGELYFWFFPSSNPKAEKEITIWLNGGPGCSSLEGFLQENGPFLWQYVSTLGASAFRSPGLQAAGHVQAYSKHLQLGKSHFRSRLLILSNTS